MAAVTINAETRELLVHEAEVQASGLGDFALNIRAGDRDEAVAGRDLAAFMIELLDTLDWDRDPHDVEVENSAALRHWLIGVRHDREALLGQSVMADVDVERIEWQREQIERITELLSSMSRPTEAVA